MEVASNVGNIWLQHKAIQQDKALHDAEVAVSKELHDIELKHAEKWNIKNIGVSRNMHQEAMNITKKIYLWDTSTDLSQHFQQLNTDLISANKESDRDMYDQRSAQFQTIIVSATVMFAALCTVIIEGNLPAGCCNQVIEYLLAIFSGFAFAFLFLSIVLSIKVILLSSHFMYAKAQKHNKILRETIEKTSDVLRLLSDIRMKARKSTTSATLNRMFESHHDNMQKFVTWREHINEAIFRNEGSHLRNLPQPGATGVDQQHFQRAEDESGYEKHDELKSVHPLQPMDTCNSLPDVARRATSPLNRHTGFEKRLFGSPEATLQLVSTFEHFWGLKCHSFAVAALVTFYLGTSFLLGAIAVFMYAKFLTNYENTPAGWITVSFICVSCIIGGILILLRDDTLTYYCCSSCCFSNPVQPNGRTLPSGVHSPSPVRINQQSFRFSPQPSRSNVVSGSFGGRGGGEYKSVPFHEYSSSSNMHMGDGDYEDDELPPVPQLRRTDKSFGSAEFLTHPNEDENELASRLIDRSVVTPFELVRNSNSEYADDDNV